jgi:hypothetical protein
MASHCKENTDLASCTAQSDEDFIAHNCYDTKFAGSICGGTKHGWEQLLNSKFADGETFSFKNCKLACTGMGDDCQEFAVDEAK